MGMTHGETDTFPRTADVMLYCEPADALKVAEAVMTVQRDWGNRKVRKNARLKYTIERYGLKAFREEVERRVGKPLQDPKPFRFEHNGDRYGWVEGEDGRHHLTLYVASGRIKDHEDGPRILSGLRRIAEVHQGDFRLTGNQNVIIANVPPTGRRRSTRWSRSTASPPGRGAAPQQPRLRGAADLRPRAGRERALPAEPRHRAGGQPRGARPPGRRDHHPDDRLPQRLRPAVHRRDRLVGRGPERYNLYLGAAFDGSRLGKLYADDVSAAEIRSTLDPLFGAYARGRNPGERFGDFLIRAGHVARTVNGPDFHSAPAP